MQPASSVTQPLYSSRTNTSPGSNFPPVSRSCTPSVTDKQKRPKRTVSYCLPAGAIVAATWAYWRQQDARLAAPSWTNSLDHRYLAFSHQHRHVLTQILADSSTEAAWWGAIGQGVGALATLAAVVVALWLPLRADRHATAERRAQLAAEVMAAVLELRTAIEVARIREYKRPGRWAGPLGIFLELYADGRPNKARFATALLRANDLNLRAADFAVATVSGPTARCYSALSRVSLSGNEELRLAADQLREAVASLLSQFEDDRRWRRACRRLDKSVAHFRAVTVKVTGAGKH